MSRFFSRPPPSYKREDVPLIGSIKTGAQKLQNERGKPKQRIENSREKNEKVNRKRSREEHDKLHYLEDINKKRHDKRVKFNESCLDISKGDPDLLERSDLSEEHDSPAFLLKQCNSSESTQSSNKLRDADPNRKKQGLVIRIKLPSKKQKDPEPASRSVDPRTSFQATKSSNVQFGLPESLPPRKIVPLVKLKDPQLLPAILPLVKLKDPQLLPAIPLVKLKDPRPLPAIPLVKLKDPRPLPAIPLVKLNDPRPLPAIPLVKLKDTQPLSATEDPCFSGRVAQVPTPSEANLRESRHLSSSSGRRHGGHRARKSEKRFRDLILNLTVPPIQVAEADAGDEDWLFAPRQPRHEKPGEHLCRTVIPQSSVCPSIEGSLQPRACYIPELDTYQLPYVIPF